MNFSVAYDNLLWLALIIRKLIEYCCEKWAACTRSAQLVSAFLSVGGVPGADLGQHDRHMTGLLDCFCPGCTLGTYFKASTELNVKLFVQGLQQLWIVFVAAVRALCIACH